MQIQRLLPSIIQVVLSIAAVVQDGHMKAKVEISVR
jgi:hypothetical protein